MKSLIYLIRHGEIDRPAPRTFIGQIDLALNANGIRQAEALHEQLKNIPFSGIFTSPLQRAVQTAALASGQSVESLHPIEQFKEINLGAWEGLTVDQVRKLYPQDYEQRGRDLEFFRPQGGGESFADLSVRCYPPLLGLAKAHPGPLLVVAHAGVNRVLISRLQHKSLQQLLDIPQDYCGINILSCNSGQLKVEAVNLHKLC
jgi:probable phosphoglycerate mutase